MPDRTPLGPALPPVEASTEAVGSAHRLTLVSKTRDDLKRLLGSNTGESVFEVIDAIQKSQGATGERTEMNDLLRGPISASLAVVDRFVDGEDPFALAHELNNIAQEAQLVPVISEDAYPPEIARHSDPLDRRTVEAEQSVLNIMEMRFQKILKELHRLMTHYALQIDPKALEQFKFPDAFQSARILVIDDNRRIVRVLKDILLAKGAATVDHRADLTERTDLSDYDLILLDDQLENGRKGHALLPLMQTAGLIIAHTGNRQVHENPANAYAEAGLPVIHKCDLAEFQAVMEHYAAISSRSSSL